MNWGKQTKEILNTAGYSDSISGDDLLRELQQEIMGEVPLYMTPMEIRRKFNVPMGELVLGVAYDPRRGWQPETIPIAPDSSLALVTQGNPYENGALMTTLLRLLTVTHKKQCQVFGFGELKKYVEVNRDFERYIFPGANFDAMEDFFSNIDDSIEAGHTPVLFMDVMNQMEDAYGPSRSERPVSLVGAFESFMQLRKEQIMMVGSLGFFGKDSGVAALLPHFRHVLWQVSDDPVASEFGLAYNNQKKQFVQAAANKWVQAYQTYVTQGITSMDLITNTLQIKESDIEFDD